MRVIEVGIQRDNDAAHRTHSCYWIVEFQLLPTPIFILALINGIMHSHFTSTLAMAKVKQLFVRSLDAREGYEHIFNIDLQPDWDLTQLRLAVKGLYLPYTDVFPSQVKIWAPKRYLCRDIPPIYLSGLDTKTPTYYGVPLVEVDPVKTIVSYFPEEFDPYEQKKIHLVVKLGTGLVLAKPAS